MRKHYGFGMITLALAALTACGQRPVTSGGGAAAKSLTLADAPGKKHYFGWGQVLDGFMGNETKYDVKHTHDIFSSGAGGNYEATTLVEEDFGTREVQSSLKKIAEQTGKDDMYVQYSSGHGYEGGLAVGGDYSTMVDTLMSMKAKEVVVFTMACFSGSLVDEVKGRKSEWSDWKSQGRTLFVMSSSTAKQESSTGPRTDRQEQAGVDGSAGSAYGHALWKSLTGEADGALDGVKDGFISLGEIAVYATALTEEIAGHKPEVTGIYDANVIMNKVPSGAYTASQVKEGGTGGKTSAEVRRETNASDRLLTQWPGL